jgi:hypothetical protein
MPTEVGKKGAVFSLKEVKEVRDQEKGGDPLQANGKKAIELAVND